MAFVRDYPLPDALPAAVLGYVEADLRSRVVSGLLAERFEAQPAWDLAPSSATHIGWPFG